MTSLAPTFVLVERAVSEDLCRQVRDAMDAGVAEPTEVLGDGIELVEEVRRASHVEVADEILRLLGACLDSHRDAIGASLGRRLSAREGTSLLRYDVGGYYRPHVDRATAEAWPAAARRNVTVVVFLDSSRDIDPCGGFAGGLLRLLPPGAAAVDIPSIRGRLVAFPSDLPHEVTTVTSGRRDTVVDWFS